MAFKMRCPKCFGFDYSVERDNRTFGTVAQTFELVFHCRCGKQLFGEQLLKEYEQQKKDFEAGGGIEQADDPRTPIRRGNDELLRQAELQRRRQNAAGHGSRSDFDDDSESSDEDAFDGNRRWKERMAALTADDGDNDSEDDTPTPAPTQGRKPRRSARTTPPPSKAPAAAAPPAAAAAATAASIPPADEEEEEEEEEEDDEDDDGDPNVCAWPGCENPRRPNSKYCSRACSNKNARSRHKTRSKKPGKNGDHLAA